MGLDMYALSTKAKPETDVDFSTKNFEQDELHYWRKHPNLHGWMQNLYDMKGGTSPDFNGDCVVLDSEDLDNLEQDIKDGTKWEVSFLITFYDLYSLSYIYTKYNSTLIFLIR